MVERRNRKPIANVFKGRPQDEPSFRERVYRTRPANSRRASDELRTGRARARRGLRRAAIGNIMHATPDDGRNIPWHRVINAQGGCSTAGLTVPPDLQQRLLETEGVVFNDKDRCEIGKYLWAPPEYEEESKRGNENQGDLFS